MLFNSTRTRKKDMAYWLEQAKGGERYLKERGSKNQWELYRKAYRSKYAKSVIPVNLVYAVLKNLIPRVYFRNPHVSVVSKRTGFEGNAVVVEHIDNLLIRELDMRKLIKRVLVDTFLCGYGVVKLGYSFEFGDSIVKDGDDYKVLEKKVEYDTRIKRNFPWVKRVLPERFLVPYGTTDLDAAPWLGMVYFRPVEDVERDPRFKHTKDLQANFIMEVEGDYGKKKELEYVKLYEIYDKREWKIYTIAEGAKDFLQNEENSLPIVPFEVLTFSESPDDVWYPPSDVESFFPLQLEANEIETQIQAHRRIAVKRFLYKNGVFGKNAEAALANFMSEEVGVGVGIDGDPSGDISQFDIEIPESLFRAKDSIRNDIREIVGMSQNQMGAFVGKTHIAEGEGRRVQNSLDERMSERRDEVANFLTRVVNDLNDIIFTKWNVERVEPIVGRDMVQYWVQYKGDQLRGEYNVQITGEDIAPLNTEYRLQELNGLVQLLATNPLVDQAELTRQVVGMVRGFDGSRLLKPQASIGGNSPDNPMRPEELPNAAISGQMPQMPQGI